jgi:hypothetical protein
MITAGTWRSEIDKPSSKVTAPVVRRARASRRVLFAGREGIRHMSIFEKLACMQGSKNEVLATQTHDEGN